jgi:hypothetical protein
MEEILPENQKGAAVELAAYFCASLGMPEGGRKSKTENELSHANENEAENDLMKK